MLHPSDSTEQRQAESPILSWLNAELGVAMSPYVHKTEAGKRISVDGYDPAARVACEIFARVGELKPGQKRKVASDILKLMWFERQLGEPLQRKIICFASEEAAKVLDNTSWLAAAAVEFGVTFRVAHLDPAVIARLLLAQQQQFR